MEVQLELAQKLLKKNFDLPFIERMTGLSVHEIKLLVIV